MGAGIIDGVDWPAELAGRAEPGLLDGVAPERLAGLADDAVALVSDSVPAAARRLASGALSRRTFARIVCDMVLRVVRNPSGVKSESDGVYSYTSAATVASGDLWLPDKDRALLAGPASLGVPGTFGLGADRGWGR